MQRDKIIKQSEDYITCKSCENMAHMGCAKLAMTLSGGRGKKNYECKHCKSSKQETGSVHSENSDNNDDESIKTMIINMNKNMEKKMTEIIESCSFLSDKYDELCKQNEEQGKVISDLSKVINGLQLELKKKDATVQELTDRITELEQNQLANKVEIHGIPVKESEDVSEIVKAISEACGLSTENIVGQQRARTKRVHFTPPILVEFASSSQRAECMQRKRGKNLTTGDVLKDGSTARVFINEQLTQYNRKLLWMAKVRAREMNYK
jgi:uncharacterized coiled-coil protein SlyX